MNLEEIQNRLDSIASLLASKGHGDPTVHLTIKSGGRVDGYVSSDCNTKNVYEFFYADHAYEALDEMRKFATASKDAGTAEKEAAVAQFGKAVDAVRMAGFDAKFVDPLAATMKAMSENLLTHDASVAQ